MTQDEETQGSAYLNRARKDLLAGSVWTVIGTVLTTPVTLAANIALAGLLGPSGLGHLAYYSAVFAVIQIATNLGYSEATVQWLSEATARGQTAVRRDLIRSCSGYHILCAGPLLALGACLLILGHASVPRECVVAASVLVTALAGTATIINTANARNAISAKIAAVAILATQTAVVAAAAVSRDSTDTFLVQIGLSSLGPLVALATLSQDDRAAILRPKVAFGVPPQFRSYALSACAGALVATLVFGRSEVIVLRADGYVVAAGIFTVITGIAGQMTGLLDSALGPLTAIAAGVVAVDPDRGRRMFARSLAVSSTVGAFFVCVFVPIAILFLNVFYAKQYSAATADFGALALVSGTQTVLGPLNAFAFATRSAAQLLRVNLLCLFFDAAVALGAIPLLGLWGAVAANAGAQALSLLALVKLVSRRLDYPQRSILLQCRLFGLSVMVTAAEIAACILIRESALLLMPFIGGLGVIALRFSTWKWPVLAISPEDFEQLGRMSDSRKMTGAMRVLKWIGAVA